ncbi:hypothetical protein LTR78_006888 [Recurvomyces mirabilis]|uniref:Uncharacterized protein n=1 Tax=Recurvomyces mirabilis TaxID=574656 RepID=A0AAE1BZI4_9PEZI|nr:hypothetical protein LTR78_006888 [Recurvomyces mirabilis]KAK5153121.1 hypothetical protein LTS14_007765 [Recurvomyces mirabilis]
MSLSQQEFEKTWEAAGENQAAHAIDAAWRPYQLVNSSSHTSRPECHDTTRAALERRINSLVQDPTISKASASHHLITLPANCIPWTPTGRNLKTGTTTSIFSSGRLWRSKLLDLWVGPQFGVWYRIGVNGRVFNSTADSNTFVTGTSGELYIANQLPGWFTNPIGGRVSDNLGAYHATEGNFELLVIVWKPGTDVQSLFQKTSLPDDSPGAPFVKQELDRAKTEDERPTPPGSTIYISPASASTTTTGIDQSKTPCIHCKPYQNVGIIQTDLEPAIPLKPGTKVSWDWLLISLPSRTREDLDFTHDYLSVAFEFENGRDLTYTWSWELPEEYGYWCPFSTWTDRECHVVIRSETKLLGQWLGESRDIYADYVKYIDDGKGDVEAIPKQVVKVWLIAANMLQKHKEEMTVKDLKITGREGAVVEVI